LNVIQCGNLTTHDGEILRNGSKINNGCLSCHFKPSSHLKFWDYPLYNSKLFSQDRIRASKFHILAKAADSFEQSINSIGLLSKQQMAPETASLSLSFSQVIGALPHHQLVLLLTVCAEELRRKILHFVNRTEVDEEQPAACLPLQSPTNVGHLLFHEFDNEDAVQTGRFGVVRKLIQIMHSKSRHVQAPSNVDAIGDDAILRRTLFAEGRRLWDEGQNDDPDDLPPSPPNRFHRMHGDYGQNGFGMFPHLAAPRGAAAMAWDNDDDNYHDDDIFNRLRFAEDDVLTRGIPPNPFHRMHGDYGQNGFAAPRGAAAMAWDDDDDHTQPMIHRQMSPALHGRFFDEDRMRHMHERHRNRLLERDRMYADHRRDLFDVRHSVLRHDNDPHLMFLQMCVVAPVILKHPRCWRQSALWSRLKKVQKLNSSLAPDDRQFEVLRARFAAEMQQLTSQLEATTPQSFMYEIEKFKGILFRDCNPVGARALSPPISSRRFPNINSRLYAMRQFSTIVSAQECTSAFSFASASDALVTFVGHLNGIDQMQAIACASSAPKILRCFLKWYSNQALIEGCCPSQMEIDAFLRKAMSV